MNTCSRNPQDWSIGPHTYCLTRRKLFELGWNVLPHTPYSSGIAPSDHHLFRSLHTPLSYKTLQKIKNFMKTG